MSATSISIVIPVYNEEESLAELHAEVTGAMSEIGVADYEVVYVDDGSADESPRLLKELHGQDPEHVSVILLRRNFGQTAAMAAGFDAASKAVIIPMDADLQNDPRDIGLLLKKVAEGYDVVSGWRADRQDKLLSRRLPSVLANALISRITGVYLHDYGCTLKAYHRNVVEHMNLYGEMHRFLPALASWAGARVAEVPVNHRARKHGTSKYGIGRTTRVILDLLTVKFLLSYSSKPMQIFGLWGLIAFAGGSVFLLITLTLKLVTEHHNITNNPYIYMAILFFLGGIQFISLGLLGEVSVRTYYESQAKTVYTVRERLCARKANEDGGDA